MKWKIKDSVLACPYVPLAPRGLDPVTVALIASGAVGLGSAIAGGVSSTNANRANAKINEQNIAAAKEMQRNQFDYNKEMYNRQYIDSLPSSVRKRYEEAGLNPYLMMQGQGYSSPTALSGSSGSVPSSIPMQSYQPDVSPITGALDAYASNRLAEEQMKGIAIDNQTREQKNLFDLQERRLRLFNDLENGRISRTEARRNISLLDDQIELAKRTLIARENQIKSDSNLASARYEELQAKNNNDVIMQSVRNALEESQLRLSWSQEKALKKEIEKLSSEIAKLGCDARDVRMSIKLKGQEYNILRPDEYRANDEMRVYDNKTLSLVEKCLDRFHRAMQKAIPDIRLRLK